MRRRLPLATTVASVLWCCAATAGAQTTEAFFNPGVIHRLDVLVNTSDWAKLKADFETNQYYPADVRWEGVTVRNVGIRSRGFGSRSPIKPGLRVDINRYAEGQTFLGLKSFQLDNLAQDPTAIRELVAMKFYARLGLPAVRVAPVQVYINNAYAGLYALIESVDKDFLKRVYGERPGTGGGTAEGDTENDGFLFEYDWQGPWGFTYLGPDLEPYASRFSAKTHENDSDFDKYHDIEQWAWVANNAPASSFVADVSAYLDLTVFVKTVAAEAFLAEYDGLLGFFGMANFYLYRFEDTTRHQFIPWDADRTFYDLHMSVFSNHSYNVLMRRAMEVPALRETFYRAVIEAADIAGELAPGAGPGGQGWLEREIEAALTLVQWSVSADPFKLSTNEDFDEGAVALRLFARQRSALVRCEIARAWPGGSAGPAC